MKADTRHEVSLPSNGNFQKFYYLSHILLQYFLVLVLLGSGKSFYICCLSTTTITFRNYRSERKTMKDRGGEIFCVPHCLALRYILRQLDLIIANRRTSSDFPRFLNVIFLRSYTRRSVKVIYQVLSPLYVVPAGQFQPTFKLITRQVVLT